jgi:uncharacterized protein YndB with AHSA1/START domain
MEQASLRDKPALSIDRHYPVAPEKVWRAWTDPQAIVHWWGPGGHDPVSRAELDVRVGGRFRIVFGGPRGTEHECAGIYKEVVPNRKLVFTWCWPNSTPERVSQVTILFKAAGTGTDLQFRHEQFFDAAARDGHLRGWSETFVKLEQFLAGAWPSLTVSRDYRVAPDKVWRAWTDPRALGQWFRPDASFSVPVAEADVRVGGRFHVRMINAKGEEFDVSGTYREVVHERKLVMTWSWKQQSGHESLVTVSFSPSGEGTRLELRHAGFLDFVDQPTHEEGWQGALETLAQILKEKS